MAFFPFSVESVTDLNATLAGGRAGYPGFPAYPGLSPDSLFGGTAANRAQGLPAIPGFPSPQPLPNAQGNSLLFPGTPGFQQQPQMFPGTPGFAAGPGGPEAANQMADNLMRMACACGIDGCDCDEAVDEINSNNSLLNSLQQNFQTQQLAQLVGLLVALMQNKGLLQQKGNGRKAKAEQVEAAGGGGDDDGHGHGGASSAGSVAGAKDVNGISVVTRMGKQIGARIAKQFDDMVAAAKKDGVTLTITSGFRSRAEQERLYAAYKNGTGNLAARPGTSTHEKGDAIDFGGGQAAYDWLAKNASKFGMHGNVPGEPWHYSLSGN